jgi:regulator of sirC expression with transglutaminase-like and TPR domain
MVNKNLQSKVAGYLDFLSKEAALLDKYDDMIKEAVKQAKQLDSKQYEIQELHKTAGLLLQDLKQEVDAIKYYQKTAKKAAGF